MLTHFGRQALHHLCGLSDCLSILHHFYLGLQVRQSNKDTPHQLLGLHQTNKAVRRFGLAARCPAVFKTSSTATVMLHQHREL